jgi:hypothetical protein
MYSWNPHERDPCRIFLPHTVLLSTLGELPHQPYPILLSLLVKWIPVLTAGWALENHDCPAD